MSAVRRAFRAVNIIFGSMRPPPGATPGRSSAASDVYKGQLKAAGDALRLTADRLQGCRVHRTQVDIRVRRQLYHRRDAADNPHLQRM